MKKWLSLSLCIILLLSFVLSGCDEESKQQDNEQGGEQNGEQGGEQTGPDSALSYEEAIDAGDYESAYDALLSGDKEANPEDLGKFITLPISVDCKDYDGEYKATFSYNEQGLLTKLDIARKRSPKVYSFTYDENGNILTEMFGDADGSYINYFTTNTYDNNGKLVSSVTKKADESETTVLYTYDKNGRVLTETETTVDRWNDTSTYIHTSLYDANGNLLSRRNQKGSGAEYTYDSQNRLLTERDIGIEGDAYNIRTYTYGEDGRLVKEKWESGDDPDWWTEKSYAYDANGTQYVTLYSDSGDTEAYTYAYEFDDKGVLTKKTYIEREDNEHRVSLYDAAGNIVSIDITKGETKVKYTFSFDKFGNRTGETYSKNGDLIYSYALTFEVKYFPDGAPEISELIRELYEITSISYFF